MSLVVWSPPPARDILNPQLGEASWTSSLEVASLVVLASLLLPPMPLWCRCRCTSARRAHRLAPARASRCRCTSARPPSSSCGECDSCEGRGKKRHCLPCLDRAERGTRSSPARSTVILEPRRQRRERTRRGTMDDDACWCLERCAVRWPRLRRGPPPVAGAANLLLPPTQAHRRRHRHLTFLRLGGPGSP